MHSTHFVYGYMGRRTFGEEPLLSPLQRLLFRSAARDILYEPFHMQDSIYNGLYYTSCGALAGTR